MEDDRDFESVGEVNWIEEGILLTLCVVGGD